MVCILRNWILVMKLMENSRVCIPHEHQNPCSFKDSSPLEERYLNAMTEKWYLKFADPLIFIVTHLSVTTSHRLDSDD